MIDLLKKYVLRIAFVKADGSTREMTATLRDDILDKEAPKTYSSPGRSMDSDRVTVWDMEIKEWRAFKPSKLIYYKIIE